MEGILEVKLPSYQKLAEQACTDAEKAVRREAGIIISGKYMET